MRDFVAGRFQGRNFAAGMQYRRMIAAAESFADIRQAQVGQFLGQRHCDLARPRDVAGALLGIHFRNLDFVIIGNGLLDVVDGNLAALQREQVFQRVAA